MRACFLLPTEAFLNNPLCQRVNEAKLTPLEEEGTDALEVAAQADEEGTKEASGSRLLIMTDILYFEIRDGKGSDYFAAQSARHLTHAIGNPANPYGRFEGTVAVAVPMEKAASAPFFEQFLACDLDSDGIFHLGRLEDLVLEEPTLG